MSVADVEQRFRELVHEFETARISREEFKAEIEKLCFRDAQNRWWTLGAQTGTWYVYDGTRWVAGQPPEPSAATPSVSVEDAIRTSGQSLDSAGSTRIASRRGISFPRGPSLQLRRDLMLIAYAAAMAVLLILFLQFVTENWPVAPISSTPVQENTDEPSSTAIPSHSVAPVPAASGTDAGQLIAAGDDLFLQSKFDAAIAQYQAAVQLALTDPAPLIHWSRALAFRGEFHDALAKAHAAIQRAPNSAEAQAQVARVMAWSQEIGDEDVTEQAVAVGEKAVRLDPMNGIAHAYLAEIYLIAKHGALAQTQAEMALQLAPQAAEAHRAQAWVLTIQGQKELALEEWRQAVALEPNLFFRHLEFGEVLRVFFDDPTDAIAEEQKALALYGDYFPAYSQLGLAYLGAGLAKEAIPQFQRAVTLNPDDDDDLAYLGLALGKTGQCTQAIPYLEQALKIDANNPVAVKGLNGCRSGTMTSGPVPQDPAPQSPIIPPTVQKDPDD
jgi:tetratricopeptide (TPR) repeat protein